MKQGQLSAWLITECDKRNLSWAEASRRAGISPNTISDAINGTSIGPKRLLALAAFFDVPPESVYRMAGLLPPEPDGGNGIQPEVRTAVDKLIESWRRLYAEDPAAARKLMEIAIVQAKAFEAAVHAAERRMEERENVE